MRFGIVGSSVTLDASSAAKIGHSAAFSVVAGAPVAILSSDTTIVYTVNAPPARYPVVRVLDVIGNGVGQQAIAFTVTAPCSLSASQFMTDAQGAIAFSASSLTVPTVAVQSPFSCRLVASPVGFTASPVPMAFVVQPSGGTAWTGRVDGAWDNGANWTAGLPLATSSAFVAASQPRTTAVSPSLGTTNPVVASIDVEDGAQLNLSGGTLNVSKNIDARTSGSIGNGTIMIPAGAAIGGSMRGTLPSVNCQSGAYSLTGQTQLSGALTMNNCSIDLGGQSLSVAQSLSVGSSAGLLMTQASSTMQIAGNAAFASGGNQLTAGTLSVGGNFVQSGTGTFVPSGTHTVIIGQGGAKNPFVSFDDVTGSWFENLTVMLVSGKTVTINAPVRVLGAFNVTSTTGDTLSLAAGLADSPNGPISVTGSLAVNLGGTINTPSLTFGAGTVTLTGSVDHVLSNVALTLGDSLHLFVNVMGNLVDLESVNCHAGTGVTISGTNDQAVAALKQACGVP